MTQLPITLSVTTADDLPVLFEFKRDPEANYLAAFTTKDLHDGASQDHRIYKKGPNSEVGSGSYPLVDCCLGCRRL